MGIHVEIESLLQEVNLETMGMTNMLVLRLPNDEKIKLPVSDVDAQKVINARMGMPSSPAPQEDQVPEPVTATADDTVGSTDLQFSTGENGEPSAEFGGTAGPSEPAAPEPTAPPQAPRRPRSVGKDEWGYPIVRGMEGKDPGEVVDLNASNADEDGVGSI